VSVRITETCVTCGACLWECPTEAISPGDPRPLVDEVRCTECFGFFGESQCIVVCPVDAIRVEPEPVPDLAARFHEIVPLGHAVNTHIWRRITTGFRAAQRSHIENPITTVQATAHRESEGGGSRGLSGTVIARDPDVAWDHEDGQMLLCHTRTGEFYTLNEVGQFIWKSCDGVSGDRLLRRVCDAFVDEDKTPIVAAVEEFVAFLEEAELVSVQPDQFAQRIK
jgi:NAD-dependent dihydropyrimidine dehydrogenase PreA subunit